MAERSPTNPEIGRQRPPRRDPRTRQPVDPLAFPPAIPDKLRFRIGEVARLCGVQTSVLRFWETEFPQLRPGKAGSGQRLFRRRDVETALRIRHLLYAQGYTIPGARQLLRAHPAAESSQTQPPVPSPQTSLQLSLPVSTPSPVAPAHLHALRQQLQSLHTLLSHPPKPTSRPRSSPPPEPHASLFSPNLPEVH